MQEDKYLAHAGNCFAEANSWVGESSGRLREGLLVVVAKERWSKIVCSVGSACEADSAPLAGRGDVCKDNGTDADRRRPLVG
jgi:hypothetical protein